MQCLSLVLVLLALALVLVLVPDPATCQVTCVKKINNCKCQTNSGKYIDLSPLAGAADYRFKRVLGPNANWLYSYNPCIGLKCDTYNNAANCQNDVKGALVYQIGLQDTAEFGYSAADGLHIKYTNGQSTGIQRNSVVSLKCRQTGPDEFVPTDDGGTVNPFVFHSRLTSKHACEVDGGGGDGGGGGGMSGGDVLLIVFFVLIVVYLAGGFAVNVLVLKKAAGVQAMPNVAFWVAVPGCVKDGAVFSVGKVRALTTGRRQGYGSV